MRRPTPGVHSRKAKQRFQGMSEASLPRGVRYRGENQRPEIGGCTVGLCFGSRRSIKVFTVQQPGIDASETFVARSR